MSKGMCPFSFRHHGLPILLKQRTFPSEILKLDGERDMELAFDDFLKIDIRVGTVINAESYPEARFPAIKLWVDFGNNIGERKTSAQITRHYEPKHMIGRQIVAVVNFPPKQIGKFMSECLVLGIPDDNGDVVLLVPDKEVPNGRRMY